MTASRIEGTTSLITVSGGGGTGGTPDDGSVTSIKIVNGAVTTPKLADGSVTSIKIADGSIVDADIAAGAAIALSKLATNPLARANHTGTQLASTVSNFDAAVRTSRLDQMAVPTAPVDLGGQVATNGAAPVAPTDLSTKAYVDSTTGASAGVPATLWDAHSIVKANVNDVPQAMIVGPSTIVGRGAAGVISALTAAQAKAILALVAADVSDLGTLATKSTVADADITGPIALSKLATDPLARANHTGTQLSSTISDFATAVGAVSGTSATYDANTILKADVDNTPVPLVVGLSRLVGRAASGATYTDNFTGTNGTNLIGTAAPNGATYTGPGAWTIQANTATQTGGTGGTRLLADWGTANVTVSMPMLASFSEDGLCLRVNAATGDRLVAKVSSGSIYLQRYVADAFVANLGSWPVTTGDGKILSVTLSGTTWSVSFDGTQLGTGTGAPFTANNVHGIEAYGTTAFDSLTVTTDASISALTAAQAKTLLAIVAADVSDFNTAVRTNRLDQMSAPTAPVNMGGQIATNGATPVAGTDLATKAYADTKGLPAANAGWSVTAGYTPDKAFNPETTTVTELARVVGTLIDALKTAGVLAS